MITIPIIITIIIIIQIEPSGNKPIFVRESRGKVDESAYAILSIRCNAGKKCPSLRNAPFANIIFRDDGKGKEWESMRAIS